MFENDGDTHFRNLVASSPALKARWDAFSEQCIERARSKGFEISRDQLIQLDAVRIYVVSGQHVSDARPDAWEDEARQKLPQWRKQAENQALAEELHNASTDAMEALSRLSPTERMRKGREIDALPDRIGTEKTEALSDDERKRLMRAMEIARGGQKIAIARKLGMT